MILRHEGRDDLEALNGRPDCFLVKIGVGKIRELNLTVHHTPTVAESAHGTVLGITGKKISKKLARTSDWVKAP